MGVGTLNSKSRFGKKYLTTQYSFQIKKEAYKALEPDAERYLSVFSHMLDRHNNQFIAGNRETYAGWLFGCSNFNQSLDFLIADFLFSLRGFAPKLFEKRPDIQQYIERVQSLPRLQNYLRNRPKTAI